MYCCFLPASSTAKSVDDGRLRYAQLNDVNHCIPIYRLFSRDKYEYQIRKSFERSPNEIDTINDKIVIDLERGPNMERENIIISGDESVSCDTHATNLPNKFSQSMISR